MDSAVRTATIQLGALNVIDNTVPIAIGDAKAGDLIMSRTSTRIGHTRVIYSVTPQTGAGGAAGTTYRVVWYQGNLPPVVPQRREQIFSQISGVFGNSPRRWNFAQFR